MSARPFSASALIPAPPYVVYGIIADYRNEHPHILPKPPFVSLAVEQGGVGAGTVMLVHMRLLGQTQSFRASVIEPEPGRVLVETTDTGYVTTFTVDSCADGQQSHVTISTVIRDRGGLLAAVERWLVPRLLLPAYEKELKLLAEYAASRAGRP